MPIYEHECGCGKRFEDVRPIGQYDEPVNCPDCGNVAKRIMSVPAVVGDEAAWIESTNLALSDEFCAPVTTRSELKKRCKELNCEPVG